MQVHGRQPEASGGAWMTEPTAKLRLEATHVACGSPASAAAGTAVLSMFAALDVGRALHTANAEAAAKQSSSHNGQRRVGAATGPGAVLATFATADISPYAGSPRVANTAPVLFFLRKLAAKKAESA